MDHLKSHPGRVIKFVFYDNYLKFLGLFNPKKLKDQWYHKLLSFSLEFVILLKYATEGIIR